MPPKKKATTAEEKKAKLLDFFKSEFTFYNIKEIESQGSKKSGISSMQIKDILQMLIDDDLIKCEKCGSMNLYWCFEYDLAKALINKYSNLKTRIDDSLIQIQQMEQEISEKKDNCVTEKEKITYDKEIDSLTIERDSLQKELQKLRDNSPQKLKRLEDLLVKQLTEAENYADNIDCLVRYLSSKQGISSTNLRIELGISEFYEDLEEK